MKHKQIEMKDIHIWFELSYASYLVLPRSVLQSMPEEWQDKFVRCLDEMEDYFGGFPKVSIPVEGTYGVYLKDEHGKFISDPLKNYNRGRRIVKSEEVNR